MAFRPALAPLLRLRQSIERQRMIQLRDRNLQLLQAEERLTHLHRYMSDSDQADAKFLAAGRTAAELQFADVLRESLLRLRAKFQVDKKELERLRQQAIYEYQQAYREREVLEALLARERTAYHLEQSRRQQMELDASHLLQRWYRRN